MPIPPPNFPHRAVQMDTEHTVLCINPGHACAPIEKLDEKAKQNLANIGIEGVTEAFLRDLMEKQEDPI